MGTRPGQVCVVGNSSGIPIHTHLPSSPTFQSSPYSERWGEGQPRPGFLLSSLCSSLHLPLPPCCRDCQGNRLSGNWDNPVELKVKFTIRPIGQPCCLWTAKVNRVGSCLVLGWEVAEVGPDT